VDSFGWTAARPLSGRGSGPGATTTSAQRRMVAWPRSGTRNRDCSASTALGRAIRPCTRYRDGWPASRFPFVTGTDPTSADAVEGSRPGKARAFHDPPEDRHVAETTRTVKTGFDGVCAARLAAGPLALKLPCLVLGRAGNHTDRMMRGRRVVRDIGGERPGRGVAVARCKRRWRDGDPAEHRSCAVRQRGLG
jgi:hypothetical protein